MDSTQQTKKPRAASKISQAERDAVEKPSKKRKTAKKSDKSSSKKSKAAKTTPGLALESTATKEGQLISNMISTFTKDEQARFEAYIRGTLPGDAIREWVATHLNQRFNCGNVPLSQWVDSASSVSLVVAAVAKVYAQRLVADAVHNKKDGSTTLSVQDLKDAYARRVKQGLDPGLLFAAPQALAGLPAPHEHETLRLAALAAQEAYDEQEKKEPTKDKS